MHHALHRKIRWTFMGAESKETQHWTFGNQFDNLDSSLHVRDEGKIHEKHDSSEIYEC